jgi:CRP/FNR family transcriptional regulator, cyclic AMP receptor protein
MTADENGQLLSSSSLFSGLDEKTLTYLGERAVRQTFEKGRTIFYQGDPGDSLFVVADGLVKVWVSSGDGEEMVMATLRRPDAFGELSAVDGQGRSASATALEPSVLVSLDRTTLLDAVHRNPNVADAMLRALGGLARRITEQASDLVFLDLAGRVAKCLVHLTERDGRAEGDVTILELPLTQTELAEMVGGSRQSVNHILKTFETRGLLELRGRDIAILDLDALRHRGER